MVTAHNVRRPRPGTKRYDDLYENPADPSSRVRPELLLRALQLAISDVLRGTRDKALSRLLRATYGGVNDLDRRFRAGDIKHLEEGLGLKRPKGWRQEHARRQWTLRHVAIGEVSERILSGSKTPHVFDEVAALRHISAGARTIENWWYSLTEENRKYQLAATKDLKIQRERIELKYRRSLKRKRTQIG